MENKLMSSLIATEEEGVSCFVIKGLETNEFTKDKELLRIDECELSEDQLDEIVKQICLMIIEDFAMNYEKLQYDEAALDRVLASLQILENQTENSINLFVD